MSTNKTSNLGLHSWVRPDRFSMDEFNENFNKIDRAVGEMAAAMAAIPRFKIDSYVGTGEYGPKSPCTLTFDFEPKLVMITGKMLYSTGAYAQGTLFLARPNGGYVGILSINSTMTGEPYTRGGYGVDWGANSVSWYYEGSYASVPTSAKPYGQANSQGDTYNYLAIG